MKIMVIGFHLFNELAENNEVVVIGNLSTVLI